jgi:adenine-specific DNA methylase
MNAKFRKDLGAYYTDRVVADFLVSWAVKSPESRVLDPSCGDGVFILSAHRRIETLGGKPSQSVYGIDIQTDTISELGHTNIPVQNIITSDFFKVEPSVVEPMDAIVGNPPFIRYQRFNGETRKNALKICRQVGVVLPELTSSWAPFLIHATRFLRPGGRMAMVIPAEINHAFYAQPLVRYLLQKFGVIDIIAFRKQIFSKLSQDAYCLLADNYGQECQQFSLLITDSALSLTELDLSNGIRMDIQAIREGRHRLSVYILPEAARRLYLQLVQENFTYRLGDIADVGVGYVTGANEYFHLSRSEVCSHQIPGILLKPAVRSGRQLKGIRFTHSDWARSEAENNKVWLLFIPPNYQRISKSVREYLQIGATNKVPEAFKCRSRQPWYSVPNVYIGDAFLSYMSGNSPRLVANAARAVASNTLHVLNLRRNLFSPQIGVSPENLATLWYTSFTLLSSEIEGHALGGGMLKLEPSEAENVRMVVPESLPVDAIKQSLDNLLREEQFEVALDYADTNILVSSLGLTHGDCTALRDGFNTLRLWRMR